MTMFLLCSNYLGNKIPSGDRVKKAERTSLLTKTSLIAILVGVCFTFSANSFAQGYDNTTNCPTLVSDLGGDQPGPGGGDAVHYVESVFTAMDMIHLENGDPGIVAKWSDKGLVSNVALVIDFCRQHPAETVFGASADVYNGLRSLETTLGGVQ